MIKAPKIKNPLFISILFSITGLTVVGQIYLPISILAEISAHFNINYGNAGMVSSAFCFSYAIGFLFSGPLSDRFGRRKVLLVGFILILVSTLLVSQSDTFSQLIAFRILQGLAASTFPPVILTYINENFYGSWKVTSITLMSLGFLTASIVAQLLSIIMRSYGFNTIELLLVPVYAISLAFLYLCMENKQVSKSSSLIDIYRRMPSLIFHKELKWLYASTLCTLSVLVAFYILMDSKYGVNLHEHNISSFISRAIALPAMFLSLLAPRLISKIGAISLLRWSFSIASIGLIIGAISVYFESVWGLLIASVIFIGGRAFSVPSLVGSIGNIANSSHRGSAISLYTFILFVGASLGPSLAHALSFINYSFALIVLSFIAVVPSVLTLFIS